HVAQQELAAVNHLIAAQANLDLLVDVPGGHEMQHDEVVNACIDPHTLQLEMLPDLVGAADAWERRVPTDGVDLRLTIGKASLFDPLLDGRSPTSHELESRMSPKINVKRRPQLSKGKPQEWIDIARRLERPRGAALLTHTA